MKTEFLGCKEKQTDFLIRDGCKKKQTSGLSAEREKAVSAGQGREYKFLQKKQVLLIENLETGRSQNPEMEGQHRLFFLNVLGNFIIQILIDIRTIDGWCGAGIANCIVDAVVHASIHNISNFSIYQLLE